MGLRRFLITFVSGLALTLPAHAGNTQDAAHFVDSVGVRALEVIQNTKLGKAQKQEKLEALFADSVDVEWVAKFVLGRFWRQLEPTQRDAYLRAYREFLTKHYTARFAEYTQGMFKVTGTQDDGDGSYTVNTTIQGSASDEPVIVDYRVHDGGKHLEIYDIVVEGVSLITTQRSEFTAVVAQQGVDPLIAQLAAKTDALTRGETK